MAIVPPYCPRPLLALILQGKLLAQDLKIVGVRPVRAAASVHNSAPQAELTAEDGTYQSGLLETCGRGNCALSQTRPARLTPVELSTIETASGSGRTAEQGLGENNKSEPTDDRATVQPDS